MGIQALLGAWLAFTLWVAHAGAPLPLATDLKQEALLAARDKVPLIVLYSLPGCPHCEVVRRSHLVPLGAIRPPRARVVQVDLGSSMPLTDFSGKKTTHGDHARQQKVVLAPVVMFVDRAGESLAGPLVGSMIPDFYAAYFEDALIEAQRKLKSGTQPGSR